MSMQHWYLHVDLDAFFASVEQLDHPEYKGKPVIVGGKPEDRRSVVSTASYEARKFGVHSAMPTFQAYKLCPQGIFVHGRMKRYAEISYQIMNIFRDFSPDVDQMSIDEAFIDLTGTEKLFGPPEETAMQIKKKVKEMTGLTVSVGLATTKYVAKIASGLSKPDGFCHVHSGEETEFMLNLPLDKVWGLGTKSQENLKAAGLFSPRDIYEKSYDTLEFLFGATKADFLYNAVRGNENKAFYRETKSHSISAETTFSFDLTDSYTAETSIMELAHGVFFRLLKEKSYSRTVMLKIRYEDFTTVSIQETLEQPVMTLDSFFEIAKQLFNQKYEKGRGIRLLGIGFENVEKTEKPYQQSLFEDTNQEKKKAVEQAILKLSQKHPEIKIHKARILKNSLDKIIFSLISILALSFISPAKSYAQSAKQMSEKEALFDWDINDTDSVSFLLNGYWKFDIFQRISASFSKQNPFVMSYDVPVFRQQVDISAWAFINQHWYFEAAFSDEFNKNTIAAGYIGDGTIREARLSNRNIKMAGKYSADYFGYGLGGGKNQAPGFSVQFADSVSDRWTGDALIRYDMTSSRSKVFYGKNTVIENKIEPSDYLTGHFFVFPQDSADELSQIRDIYVENKRGNYKSASGKRFVKLSETEYEILQETCRIILSSSAHAEQFDGYIPEVLITFTSDSFVTALLTKTGSYSDSQTFKGKIQTEFNSSGKNIDLSKYAGSDSENIDGKKALIIQNSIGFYPFNDCSVYNLGLSEGAEITVIYDKSEKQAEQFYSEPYQDIYRNTKNDFFTQGSAFYSKLFLAGSGSRYPFAGTNPEVYLNKKTSAEFHLIKRTFIPVSEFRIGSEAVAGTVQVYINGVLDYGAHFVPEKGIIELSRPVMNSDKIIVMWQEDNGGFTKGSLAAGSAFNFRFNDFVNTDFALTTRWAMAFDNYYTTPDKIDNNFVAFTTGTTFKNTGFTLADKTAFAVQTQNAAGKLLVNSYETNLNKTYYLQSSSGYVTNATPHIDKLPAGIAQPTNSTNATVKDHEGQNDGKITGYRIPLAWKMDDYSTWASVDIKLSEGSLLKNASIFNFAIKPALPSVSAATDAQNYKVYLQLGVNASEDFYGEESNLIPTFEITDSAGSPGAVSPGKLDLTVSDWQIISVELSDIDRARLCGNCDARIIIIRTDGNPGSGLSPLNGTIYGGPYEPVLQSVFVDYPDQYEVLTSRIDSVTPSSRELHKSENHSASVRWNTQKSSVAELPQTKLIAVTNFTQADLSIYKSLNFDFAVSASSDSSNIISATPQNQDFTLILDSNADSPRTDGDAALILKIKNINQQVSATGNLLWNTLSINLLEKSVSINGITLSSSDYELYINKKNIPTRQKIILDTNIGGSIYKSGTLYVDNLYYSDAASLLTAQNNFYTKYDFEKGFVELDSTQSGVMTTESRLNDDYNSGSINAKLSAEYSLFDILFGGDFLASWSSSSDNNNALQNAGHKIQTEKKLGNIVSFGEEYRFNHQDKSTNKSDNFELDFSHLNFPLTLQGFSTAASNYSNQNQNATLSAAYNYEGSNFGIGLSTEARTNQRINTRQAGLSDIDSNNYFNGWLNISELQFSTGNKNAQTRNISLSNKINSALPFAHFEPSVEYNLSGNYSNYQDKAFSDSESLIFSFPFAVNNSNSFKIVYSKTSSGNLNLSQTSISYLEDTNLLAEGINQHNYLYKTVPFYDLFNSSLKNDIQHSTGNNYESAYYSSKYDFSWRRRLSNTLQDLYIPSSVLFSISRDIKAETRTSDLYQLKTTITNTSVNNFGLFGKMPLLSWYESDEIITSLTGIVKVPADNYERTTFLTTAYIQTLFYINDSASLLAYLDFSLATDYDWGTNASISWIRPGTTALIKDIADYITKKQIIYEISRKDSLSISLSRQNEILSQKYTYLHSTEVRFLKHYSLSTSLGANFYTQQKSASLVELTLTIGGKMEF